MAQQTINVGTSPNDGTGTPLRTAFQYTNSNFSELYTAVGPSGNNIVCPGSATITGALTIGGATSFPASVINTSGGNPVFTPTASTLFLYSGSAFLSIRNQANTQEISNLTPAGVYTFGDGAGGTRMTLNSTGLGVGVTPAGTGGCLQLKSGITFPATQVASSDVNTLDDYEEGTFTPIIAGSTSAGTGTYSIQSGRYTKIGRLVQFQIRVAWSAHTGTGNLNIDQLPFVSSAVANSFASVSIGYFSNVALSASRVATAFIETNATYIALAQYPVGGGSFSYVPIDTDGDIMISGTYTV